MTSDVKIQKSESQSKGKVKERGRKVKDQVTASLSGAVVGWSCKREAASASSRQTKQSGGKACQKNLRNTSYKFREIHLTELDKYT